jgi:hypothetical protein
MMRTVNDAIAVAMKLTEKAAEAFLGMQDDLIPAENLSDIVSGWSKRFSIPEQTRISWDEAVAAISRRQENVTRFDVINEATYLAASLENADTRETLERMAGEMVTERLRQTTRYS